MKNDLKKKTKSSNTNNKKDLVITQLKKGNDIGNIRHFPASTKSWFSSIYSFDKNVTKKLPYLDIMVNKIIKIYFYLIPNIDDNIKFMRRRSRARIRSVNRIFVSRADIKHFNDKVIITIYTFNRIKKYYLKKKQKLLNILKYNSKNTLYLLYNTFKFIKKKYGIFRNHIKKDLPSIFFKLKYLSNMKNFENQYYKTIIVNILRKELLIFKYNRVLMADYYKNNNIFLCRFNKFLSIVYKKKVEFNIVNLKHAHLDINILLNSINLKIRNNRKITPVSIFNKAILLPKVNISKVYCYSMQNKYIKKYNELNLNYTNFKSNQNSDIINSILYRVYNINKTIEYEYDYINIYRSIKLRELKGIQWKAKGRITRRLTAERAITKIKYKGNLQNIDSSFNGLSAVFLRNNIRSNIDYLLLNSKTRNGSFGLRGWLSSK